MDWDPDWGIPTPDVRCVGVESNCVLASVSQLSSTTAPLQRQSPKMGSARIAGSAVPAQWDSISTRITAEQRHQVREAGINGFKNHKSIQLQKKCIGHPGTRTEHNAFFEKAKKETQTRKLANQEFAWCHLSWIPFAQFFIRRRAGFNNQREVESKRGEKIINKFNSIKNY